jgi:hypothetical protein
MISAPHLIPWAVHTLIVGFLSLFGSAVFHGTGLSPAPAMSSTALLRHPSVYFTASLPLSRQQIAGSRIAFGVACMAAVLAVSLAVHCLMLLVIGQPVPFIAMTKTSLLGVVLAAGLIAVSTFIALTVSEQISGLAIFAMTMGLWLSREGWSGVLQFVASSSPGAPLAILAASLALIAAALVSVRRKEL